MFRHLIILKRLPKSSINLQRLAPSVFQRCFSGFAEHQHEIKRVAVGGNGYLDVDIWHPTQTPSKSKILVHLPPGISFAGIKWAGPNFATYAETLSDVTIFSINYRLAPRLSEAEDFRFPTPIHDVSAAWDYIIDPQSPHNVITKENVGNEQQPQVSLHGSHVGGALALMLALTNPNSVQTVVLEDPLVDWTILDEFVAMANALPLQTSRRRKSTSLSQDPEFIQARAETAKRLIKLRTTLFRTPSGYFDSFASPTLFLRAPGRDTPLTRSAAPQIKDVDELDHSELEEMRYGDDDDEIGWIENEPDNENVAFGPYDDDLHAVDAVGNDFNVIFPDVRKIDATLDRTNSTDSLINGTPQLPTGLSVDDQAGAGTQESKTPAKRRKVLRRWPPNMQPGEATLPQIRIYLHEPNLSSIHANQTSLVPVTYTQGLELCDLLRKACFWGQEKGIGEERVNITLIGHDNSGEGENNSEQTKAIHWLNNNFAEKG